jgi:Skp family chaperone for outer membrane proteins
MKGMAVAALMAALLAAGTRADAQSVQAAAGGVYYGDPEGTAPATVRMNSCFAVIPEWKDIQRLGLTTEDADYWILLAAANERFHRALEKVAKAKGYDLVAEEGSIPVPEGEKPPPDATAAVVAEIRASTEEKKE